MSCAWSSALCWVLEFLRPKNSFVWQNIKVSVKLFPLLKLTQTRTRTKYLLVHAHFHFSLENSLKRPTRATLKVQKISRKPLFLQFKHWTCFWLQLSQCWCQIARNLQCKVLRGAHTGSQVAPKCPTCNLIADDQKSVIIILKGSSHIRKTVKKLTLTTFGDPPPKRVKSGHLLPDYWQKCVNATRDILMSNVRKITILAVNYYPPNVFTMSAFLPFFSYIGLVRVSR